MLAELPVGWIYVTFPQYSLVKKQWYAAARREGDEEGKVIHAWAFNKKGVVTRLIRLIQKDVKPVSLVAPLKGEKVVMTRSELASRARICIPTNSREEDQEVMAALEKFGFVYERVTGPEQYDGQNDYGYVLPFITSEDDPKNGDHLTAISFLERLLKNV